MPIASAAQPRLWRVLPATPEVLAPARHAIASFAREHGASPRRAADIALVVSEACTNAVLHAYAGTPAAGTVELEATRRDSVLVVRVADRGQGLRPRPDSPGLGLGLPLMHRLSDDLAVRENRPGTVVELSFAL